MLEEQRAARFEQFKAAFQEVVKKHHPDMVGAEIILESDFAIDLYKTGVLDAPEQEWQEFLEGMKTAESEPYTDEDTDEGIAETG